MLNVEQIRTYYQIAKNSRDPDKLTGFFKSIEPILLPTAWVIDKARAIQLSEGKEYDTLEAEKILRSLLSEDPFAIPAYIELATLLDKVLDRPDEAIEVFNRGIDCTLRLLRELNFEKTRALVSKKDFAAAVTTAAPYIAEAKFRELLEEVWNREDRVNEE